MKRRSFIAGGASIVTLGASASLSANTGFHVPPEEARHQSTFMQWPVNRRVHPDPVFLDMAQQTIADVANTIAEFEPFNAL